MDNNVVFVKNIRGDLEINEFFKRFYESDISRDFVCTKLDAISIRDYLREYLTENGVSSLFEFSLTYDAVMDPGLHIDEIEELILGFVRKLNGTKHLLIVDPYLYAYSPTSISLFERMISTLSSQLERVTILMNGRKMHQADAMRGVLRSIVPAVRIEETVTDEFHDRYWIAVDSNVGIVMGTSLGGIGKKVALVDILKFNDVKAIVALVEKEIRKPI